MSHRSSEDARRYISKWNRSHLFVAIGHEANTDYLTEDIKRDGMGRLTPNALPAGMFVAGDVHSELKMQIATAVGTGCAAGMDAIAFLNSRS